MIAIVPLRRRVALAFALSFAMLCACGAHMAPRAGDDARGAGSGSFE